MSNSKRWGDVPNSAYYQVIIVFFFGYVVNIQKLKTKRLKEFMNRRFSAIVLGLLAWSIDSPLKTAKFLKATNVF